MSTIDHYRTDHWGARNRGWRAECLRRVDRLRHDLAKLPEPAADLDGELVQLESGIDGLQVDHVWERLHRVEEEIAHRSRGDLLVDYAVWAADHAHEPELSGRSDFDEIGLPWRDVQEAARRGQVGMSEKKLAGEVAAVLRHAHAITDERHADANEARKRIVAAAWGAAALAALVVVAAIALTELPFLLGADTFGDVPTWQLVALVALGGVVGGALGAFPAFLDTRKDRYRLQYARAGARLSMGMLTALVGVALVGAGWAATVDASSAPALFAVSIAFGLAQEPVTRLLERKAAAATGAEEATGSST